MHKQLFIPGPTEVAPEVLQEMTKPLIGHRTKECSDLQKSISEKVQKLFYTENTIIGPKSMDKTLITNNK